MQRNTTIRRGVLIDREIITAGFELAAGRGCANDPYAVMFVVIDLVYVAEYCEPYFAGRAATIEKFLGFFEADRIQPGAAHDDGRVMQANHDVFRSAGLDSLVQPLVFTGVNSAARAIGFTAVNSDDEPVAYLKCVAIEKGRFVDRPLHEFANVVIAWHAVHGQVECADKLCESLVRAGGFILDKVAGCGDDVSLPVAGTIMLNDVRQGSESDRAPKAAAFVGEQMRVRQMQDPDWINRARNATEPPVLNL